MNNLQDKLNVKIPTDKIYISETSNANDKEYICYFLESSDGFKLMQLTGKDAGKVYTKEYKGLFQYVAGAYSMWNDGTLNKRIPLIKSIRYSSLLKYWKQHNKEAFKNIEKDKKKYSKKHIKTIEKESMVDEFFK